MLPQRKQNSSARLSQDSSAHCTALHRAAPRCAALRCTALLCTALHCRRYTATAQYALVHKCRGLAKPISLHCRTVLAVESGSAGLANSATLAFRAVGTIDTCDSLSHWGH